MEQTEIQEVRKYPIKVLFADDNQNIRFWMIELIGDMFVEFYSANDGFEALELYELHKPQLVITDMMMPRMNGLELVKQIKIKDKNVKFLVISAYNESKFLMDAIHLGVDSFALKPINSIAFIESLKKISHILLNEIENQRNLKLLADNEKLMNNIFNISAEAMRIIDLHKNVLKVNLQFADLYDMQPENFIGLPCYHFGHCEAKIESECLLKNTHCNQLEIQKNLNLKTLKYGVKEFIFNAIPYCDANNKVCGILETYRDITYIKENEKKTLQKVIETEEKERIRFARDLHDGLGPILSATNLYLQALSDTYERANIVKIIDKASKTVNEAINIITEISNNISPHVLQSFGLVTAVKNFVDKLNDTKKIVVHFRYIDSMRFLPLFEITVYRAVFELINNTLKHAKATEIHLNLHFTSDSFVMDFVDNGIGFDLNNVLSRTKGMGLTNIMNRLNNLGGETNIHTSPERGFKLKAIIPVMKWKQK